MPTAADVIAVGEVAPTDAATTTVLPTLEKHATTFLALQVAIQMVLAVVLNPLRGRPRPQEFLQGILRYSTTFHLFPELLELFGRRFFRGRNSGV